MSALPMNPLQIKYFLSVARTKSVARSSQELFVSAPAISKQLTALERDLNVTLLKRSHKGMALTLAGQEYYEFFAKTFAQLNNLKRRYQLDQTTELNFSLGIMATWTIYEQLHALEQQLQAVFPQLNLSLHPLMPSQLMENLANSKLDAALCIANGITLGPHLTATPLGTVQKVLVYADYLFDPPLQDPNVTNFASQTMYGVAKQLKTMTSEANTLICNDYGIQPQLVPTVDTNEALAMVAMGKGFTILDKWSLYRDLPRLQALPLNDAYDISLFSHKSLTGPLLTTMTKLLQHLFITN